MNKIVIPKQLPRNSGAVAAKQRTAGAMHDRRAPRGGDRNLQSEYLEELLDEEDYDDCCFTTEDRLK